MNRLFEEHRTLVSGAGCYTADGFGQFEVTGPDAHAYVNRIATLDVSVLPPGRFADALILRDDAAILDRVTVYRFPDRIMLLVDAQFRHAAWDYIVARKRGNVRLRDISEDVGLITVRGPAAAVRVAPLMDAMPLEPGDVETSRFAGVDVFAGRATIDGPDGLDLFCRRRDRDSLETGLRHAGVFPVIREAWELLRLEWGVARVGVEIDSEDTPLEAGLEHLVAEMKGAPFPGETALASRRRSGAMKRLVGFRVHGNDVPQVGSRVSVNGLMVDRIRSVGRSPRVGIIGMTALPTSAGTPGTPLHFELGDQQWSGEVVRRPFVTRGGMAAGDTTELPAVPRNS
ncbi:MAG: glycine cleavage T C-terminal barrel domain-containing protein [Gemmatimonadota bacterium]